MKTKNILYAFLFIFIFNNVLSQAGTSGTPVTAHNSAGSASTLTLTGGPNTCGDVGNLRSGLIRVRNLGGATNDNNRSSQTCFEVASTLTSNKNMWARLTIPAGSGITGVYFYATTDGVTPQPASGSTNVRSASIGIYSGTTTSSPCTPALICGSKWSNVICSYASSMPILRPTATERVDVTPGQTYMVEIWTTSLSTNTDYNFDILVVPMGAVPSNNNCSNAIPFTNETGCNLGAHQACNTNLPSCAFTLENSVFYSFTKPGDGGFSVTISNVQCEGGGNNLQTAIYRATPGNCNTNLNTVGNQIANRCFTGSYTYSISNADPPGTQYILWFDGNAGAACTWGITVLPVEWKRFEVFSNEDNVQIEWTTASEKNADYFIIERSTDATNWIRIGIQQAVGNSSFDSEYLFFDLTPSIGVNYYRLRQVDFDGSEDLTNIEYAYYSGNSNIGLYPNPTTGISIITGLKPKENVEVFDLYGRICFYTSTNNQGHANIDLTSHPSGVYFIKVNDKIVHKLIKN
jgi:hypothetical protein